VCVCARAQGDFAVDNIKTILEQQRFMPLEVVSFDTKKEARCGVWMSDRIKEAMTSTHQRSVADAQFCFAREFVSQQRPDVVRRSFREQMAHCREELLKPRDETTGVTRKKITAKAAGHRDDMLIAVQIALHFSALKRMEPAFRATAERFGWRY